MIPRTILYTGKGGVGKTSVAAASARACAEQGLRTIVLSTDPAHSLSDSLEQPIGPTPTPVAEHLWAQEVEAQRAMEEHWGAVREWLASMLVGRGLDRIAAEELTVPPGMDELVSLLEIRRHHDEQAYDVVIVDCAPTGETLRLLSFPDVAQWWLEKVLPWERRLVAAARPFARTFADAPLPPDDVFGEVQALVRNLSAVDEILRTSGHTSIRLVMTPDRMVVTEAQRTFTYLNLYGYATDAVVVNRVFPPDLDGGYFGPWRRRQQDQLEAIEQGFAPVPILTARYFEEEVVGPEMLARLGAEVFAEHDPAAVLHEGFSHEVLLADGVPTLRLRMPFATRDDVSLQKIGAELIVRVGHEKRTIILPSTLSAMTPAGAHFADGHLDVSFDDGRAPAAAARLG
ncbi:MAG: ArsA family ATPase [Solirubrobacterales bacterium]